MSRFNGFWKSIFKACYEEESTTSPRQQFHEACQMQKGCNTDLPPTKIVEMMKSNCLENAPIESLFSVANRVLDESFEIKNGEAHDRTAGLLRKIVQEIERRVSKQNGHTRKDEKVTHEEKNKQGQDMSEVVKEKEDWDIIVAKLRKEINIKDKFHEQYCFQLENMLKEAKAELEENKRESNTKEGETISLRQKLDKQNTELELSESRIQELEFKENIYQNFVCFQKQALQDLRSIPDSIKDEVLNSQRAWNEEYYTLEKKYKELAGVADNYNVILEENRRFYNELQEMKGNIRVYCRIRPHSSIENEKMTTVDYIGEHGELVMKNPSKKGRDSHRVFKFNKVFGPASSQEEVYVDTQPLIRSLLDGFSICIFAYGQTGSGKTYTMIGPESASKEEQGVNYRALNDLFHISQAWRNTCSYEIAVQMVEIYNEQVHDLLSNDGQKKLGIRSTFQPSGIAVPDASVHPVNSASDILELMQHGHTNRASSATALNERSSRSHSVLSVHVRGTDLKTKSVLRGCLNLVDLAGSERIDRSEVTGDRLREAQSINKSLSALGDVIAALSQKNSHVPYRNSKLTQILQSSLGGHAKTLMFVQINPDPESYSESLSTLKFAERVSGVELGAAKSSKESKDVRELMEQIVSLKDTITRKDEEIEQLHVFKELQSQTTDSDNEKYGNNTMRILHSSSSTSSQESNFQGQILREERNGQSSTRFSSDLSMSSSEFAAKYSDSDYSSTVDNIQMFNFESSEPENKASSIVKVVHEHAGSTARNESKLPKLFPSLQVPGTKEVMLDSQTKPKRSPKTPHYPKRSTNSNRSTSLPKSLKR